MRYTNLVVLLPLAQCWNGMESRNSLLKSPIAIFGKTQYPPWNKASKIARWQNTNEGKTSEHVWQPEKGLVNSSKFCFHKNFSYLRLDLKIEIKFVFFTVLIIPFQNISISKNFIKSIGYIFSYLSKLHSFPKLVPGAHFPSPILINWPGFEIRPFMLLKILNNLFLNSCLDT